VVDVHVVDVAVGIENVEASVVLLWKSESEVDGRRLGGGNGMKRQELYQDYISSKRCIVLTLEKTHQPLKHRILRTPYQQCSRG
jgi:hypothetical protein